MCQGPPQLWGNGSQEDRQGPLSHEASRKRYDLSTHGPHGGAETRMTGQDGPRSERREPRTASTGSSALFSYTLDSGVCSASRLLLNSRLR